MDIAKPGENAALHFIWILEIEKTFFKSMRALRISRIASENKCIRIEKMQINPHFTAILYLYLKPIRPLLFNKKQADRFTHTSMIN